MEQSVEVGEDQNLIAVRAEGQQWIAVVRSGVELKREASGEPDAEFVVEPGSYVIETDGSLRSVRAEHRGVLAPGSLTELLGPPERAALRVAAETAVLHVEVDATSRHPVDDVPQLPADGESACTIRLEKLGADGERLSGRGHTDEIYLRTTGGLLRAADGDAPARSVRLRAGQAAFRLIAENAPKLVTVYAFAEDSALRAEIPVEFI